MLEPSRVAALNSQRKRKVATIFSSACIESYETLARRMKAGKDAFSIKQW